MSIECNSCSNAHKTEEFEYKTIITRIIKSPSEYEDVFDKGILYSLIQNPAISDCDIIKFIEFLDSNAFKNIKFNKNINRNIEYYMRDENYSVMIAICSYFPKGIMRIYESYFREQLFDFVLKNYKDKCGIDSTDNCNCTPIIVLFYRMVLKIYGINNCTDNTYYESLIMKLLDNFTYKQLNLGQKNKDDKTAKDYAIELKMNSVIKKIESLE